MGARKSLHRKLIVKPLVVLAARSLGPGPLRLRMVKLAHELADTGYHHVEPEVEDLEGLDTQVARQARRAA